ncbi:MAG: glutamate--tRNA ligase [Christensenellales bacterium]|jgi:glutamyl-tRNA synthetase
MRVRTRFAPSPTGFMHIGNLRTALYAYLFARHNNGDFILRIEDTDQEREVEGAVDVIYKTLETANMTIDESPLVGGPYGPYIQSQRKQIYIDYAKKLVELGGAYYCFCSKERLESLKDEKGIGKYDKHCLSLSKEEIERKIANGEPYVIRQNIPTKGLTSYDDLVFGKIEVDCSDLEDNILLKSDGMPTYNFANVIDDHLMKISHVIRGSEYLSSTPKYNLIYQSFGWEIPQYMHLAPIMKDATRKLSKRYGDANFEDFIAKGYLPHAIINYIALLGWNPKNNEEKMTMDELISLFSIEGISKSSSIFDEPKMRWLNGLYINELPFDEFLTLAKPYFDKSVIKDKYDYKKFGTLLQSRIDIFSDIPTMVEFIEDFKAYDIALFNHQKMKIDRDVALKSIDIAINCLENHNDFDNTALYETLSQAAIDNGLKKGQLLWCVRVAITGYEQTPGGATELAAILGKEETLRRLKFSKTLF